jgi:hypothetical protein
MHIIIQQTSDLSQTVRATYSLLPPLRPPVYSAKTTTPDHHIVMIVGCATAGTLEPEFSDIPFLLRSLSINLMVSSKIYSLLI